MRKASQVRTTRVLILTEVWYAHGREVIRGISDYAHHHRHHSEQGRWALLFDHHPTLSVETIERHHDADAIIVEARDPELIAAVKRRGVPAVALTDAVDAGGLPSVIIDNEAVGQCAFEYLRNQGFTRFALDSALTVPPLRKRQDGYIAAAAAAGFEVAQKPLDASVTQWLCELQRPVALFSTILTAAREVATVCRQHEILVPEEVAILTVDPDEVLAGLADPPLSTIDHGARRLGYEGAALLDALMNGHPPPRRPIVVSPVGVVERRSTQTLAVEDADVAAALSLIRRRACEGLTVGQVLKEVPVARRSLEVKFRRALGRTLHDEIARVRIEYAKDLLVRSDLNILGVALRCGYRYPSRFNAVFKHLAKQTPVEFRQAIRQQHRRGTSGSIASAGLSSATPSPRAKRDGSTVSHAPPRAQ